MLEVRNLTFRYCSQVILESVSLDIGKGQIAGIIGTSGSGKSTLFKLMAGALNATEGEIAIDGIRLPKGQGQVAFMMQDDHLLPWRTVLKNMTLFGELGQNRQDLKHLQQDAESLLYRIGLGKYGNHYPAQLSGGMRQRVSLARAFLQKKPVLLLDEPFAALDVSLREHLYEMLRDIQKKFLTTIILVTHDFRDAITISDRVFLLADNTIRQEWVITDRIRSNPMLTADTCSEMRNAIVQQKCAYSHS
jgi:ABC-type nitrate/sulfonate/bicarbonate transport system ATPase subunit